MTGSTLTPAATATGSGVIPWWIAVVTAVSLLATTGLPQHRPAS